MDAPSQPNGLRLAQLSSVHEEREEQRQQHLQPPNGGADAWLKVLGCFLIYFNTWGTVTSFGVYQAQYQFHSLESYSPSALSWIGTTQVFLLFFTAIVAGPLFDKGYGRTLLYVGCSMLVVGFFMLSLATTFYQIFLSQSICMGIGSGLIFVPAVSIVSQAFTTKRPIANGLASTGSAVGGTIFPIAFKRLLPAVGLSWTNRIFGFIVLATSLLAIFLLTRITTPRTTPQSNIKPPFLDLKAFREPSYVFLCAGLFLVELGFWIPPFTIAPYAQLSLGADPQYASYLIAILNAGSFAGRILPAFAAQVRFIGPAWTLVAGSLALGVLCFGWLAISNVAGITIWAIFGGFMSGIVVSIPNAVITTLSSPSQLGARSGMMWTIVAFAAMIGAPVAGVLVDTTTNSYKWGQLFSGLAICTGCGLLCVPAVHISRAKLD